MGGDWLKVEHVLPEKPEVVGIASMLHIHEDEVVGKLLRVWRWVDQQVVDGVVRFVRPEFFDKLLSHPGFAAAMQRVGWIIVSEDSVAFPHHERHLSQGAKSRAQAASRKKKSRVHDCDVPADPPATEKPKAKRTPKPLDLPPDPSEFVFQLTRGTWTMGLEELARWKAAYPGLDVGSSLSACRDWTATNVTKRSATVAGVQRRIGKWLAKDQDDRGGRGTYRSLLPPTNTDLPD